MRPRPATVIAPPPAPAPAYRQRLLSDIEAAHYLGVSRSYLRALISNGALHRVDLPAVNGHGSARLLRLDRADLDLFIGRLK